MHTIKKFSGETCNLSDEVYYLNENTDSSRYKKGELVYLISGVDGSNIPGYHFRKGYSTVCRVTANVAEFIAVNNAALLQLNHDIFNPITGGFLKY